MWNPHGPQVSAQGGWRHGGKSQQVPTRHVKLVIRCRKIHKLSWESGKGSILTVRVNMMQVRPLCIDRDIAIVEQVRDGSNVRVRLLLPGGDQQLANIAIAGVRCPRSSSKQGDASEKWGEEVGSRVRLLH